MVSPKPATCESVPEGEFDLFDQEDVTPKRKSQTSGSTVSSRHERPPPDVRKESSRSSDSGYSTGTKASADTSGGRRPTLGRQQTSMRPPEIVPQSPTKSARPAMETRMSSARSTGSSHRSSHSSQAPSRAPSTSSRPARPEDRGDSSRPQDPVDNGVRARGEQREAERLHRTASQKATHPSPPSSRAPRAPSRISQDMGPPPLPRPRSISASRARPVSYHGAVPLPYDAYNTNFASPYGSYEREHGPPPARSAYHDKGSLGYPVRPPLSVLPVAPAGYHDQQMPVQRPAYDVARMGMPHRAQTEQSTVSSSSHYSARRPVSYYPDQPNVYDPSPVRLRDQQQPQSPVRERQGRKQVSARQVVQPAYEEEVFDDDTSDSDDGSAEEEEDDDDDYEEGGRYMPKYQQPAQRTTSGYLSARGMPPPPAMNGYGTSPRHEMLDPHLDDGFASSSDYRSSVRSKDSGGSRSSESRRLSVASSDRGTKATSYSASSGSGGYASQRRKSVYEQFQTTPDHVNDAERYMRSMDLNASHVRQQQPSVTQESLRQQNARAIEAKRSSHAPSTRASGPYARSRTVTAGEDQTIRLKFDTSAGVDLELDGDTEGRAIKLVQKPGETKAQLIIGNSGREQSVYSGGDSSSRGPGSSSKVSGRTGSTRGAVNGRRERARTVDEF